MRALLFITSLVSLHVEHVYLKEAEKAKAALDGKKALGKKIVVDWARFDPATKTNVRPYRYVLC